MRKGIVITGIVIGAAGAAAVIFNRSSKIPQGSFDLKEEDFFVRGFEMTVQSGHPDVAAYSKSIPEPAAQPIKGPDYIGEGYSQWRDDAFFEPPYPIGNNFS